MRIRTSAFLGALLFVAFRAPSVFAHGIGGRGDLPLPTAFAAFAAASALVVSFFMLGPIWTTSRFETDRPGILLRWPPSGLLDMLAIGGRLLGVVACAMVLWAGFFGIADPPEANLAPLTVWVLVWVGFQFISAGFGDVWRVVGPVDTLALILQRFRSRRVDEVVPAPELGHWPAAVGIFVLVWIELVYPSPADPRMLGALVLVYLLAFVLGALRFGRPWLRQAEPLAALFGMLARMAPLKRGSDGRLRLRTPLSGLAGLQIRPGTAALIFVLLGSTCFDGLTRSDAWKDLTDAYRGGAALAVQSLGLVGTTLALACLYYLAMWIAAHWIGEAPRPFAARFLHSLVPIAFAYVVAHYFSLFVFEGQRLIARLADLLSGSSASLRLGGDVIDYSLITPMQIGLVQAGAILLGHVAGVILAHDRAVASLPKASVARSQYPLLVVMVAYTVVGLMLLLGA